MKKKDIKTWEEELSSMIDQMDHFESDENFCEEIVDGVMCFMTTVEEKYSVNIYNVREVFFVDCEDREVFCSFYFDSESLVAVIVDRTKRMDSENFNFAKLRQHGGMFLSVMRDYLSEYPELKGVNRKFERKYEYWSRVELFNKV